MFLESRGSAPALALWPLRRPMRNDVVGYRRRSSTPYFSLDPREDRSAGVRGGAGNKAPRLDTEAVAPQITRWRLCLTFNICAGNGHRSRVARSLVSGASGFPFGSLRAGRSFRNGPWSDPRGSPCAQSVFGCAFLV